MGDVKLFSIWSSPFSLRVVWALKLIRIEYETIYEDLENKSCELLEYNPVHKKIPVLLHKGKPICESLIILEYIDETWTATTCFMPDDPLDRATARFWAKFSDEQVLKCVFRAYVSEGAEKDEAKRHALEMLDQVESQLVGNKFFSGQTIGSLDLMFGWIAIYLEIFEETGGMKLLEKEGFPFISAWKNDFLDIPVIRETRPDQEKLIAKSRLMRKYFISTVDVKKMNGFMDVTTLN